MPQTDIGSADSSSTDGFVDYTVGSEVTDGVPTSGEFRWSMTEWSSWLGYYKTIPELMTAVDAKANWTIGAGYESDDQTKIILDSIKGTGKDTFNSIIANQIRTYTIGGDSFAEIIVDDNDILVNLKPLDPGSIVIVYNTKGRIIRYEQLNKIKGKSATIFGPEQILHLSRKRIADEIHGISIIPAVEWIILARNEAMNDWKRVLHRNVEPLIIWHLDTDDTKQIAAFKAKNDAAKAGGNNMYIPKGTVVPEIVGLSTNSSMNPLTWINQLNDYFFQTVNVPQIIVGSGKEFTDASGKIVYLAYEQSVKDEQLFVEEQIALQLNLIIELTFPASMQQEQISDVPNEMLPPPQEEPIQGASEPNNTKVELEGKT